MEEDRPFGGNFVNAENGMRASVLTLQKQLRRRDSQTSELHRQLRGLEQAHWQQTLEARHASKQLQDLLGDPTQSPQLQANEIRRLQVQGEDLGCRLADARAREAHWEVVARRQKAFLMQSEHTQQLTPKTLQYHPAGEVFLAPSPLEGIGFDDEEEPFTAGTGKPWDVGSAHINPYPIDSWPAEPNVLAYRSPNELGLQSLDEEDLDGSAEEDYEGSEAEDFSDHFCSPGHEGSALRMPAEAQEPPPEPPESSDIAYRSARSL